MKPETIIRQRLEAATDLPTLPQVFMKLQRLLNSDTSSALEVGKVIKDDPALTGKILRIANSAAFGARQKISSVSFAVARLGFQLTTDIVMSLSIINTFENSKTELDYAQFWKHSLSVAFAANLMHQYAKKTTAPEGLFTAGILHDIGILLLDQYAYDFYPAVVDYSRKKNTDLYLAEEEVLGVNHATIGAEQLVRWELPQRIIEAVACHHNPVKAESELIQTGEIIHLANFVCNNQGIHNGLGIFPTGFSQASWFDCGFLVEDIDTIIEEVNTEVEKSEVMLAATGT